MIDHIIVLLIQGLATNAVVECFHHGSIFDGIRGWLEFRLLPRKYAGKLAELFLCPYCLSHWISLIFAILYHATGYISGWLIPVFWFAGARVSHLINDLLKPWLRTPGSGLKLE